VIRQIEQTDGTYGARQTGGVSPATPAGREFAHVLASQKRVAGLNKDAIVAPEGEVWRPVRGDDNYAKIVEGPRAGMYINLSRGDRRGETFTVENRDGERVHVYQGKNGKETVVKAAKDSGKVHDGDPEAASASRRPGRETWAPVDGANNYADILSGPRNGWFVNTSGGTRDGMAFHIVHKGDKTFHVYGSGKHRQMVEVSTPEPNKAHGASGGTKPGKGDVAASETATGGAEAPSDD
jgi:hypothetical protein